MKSTGPTGAEDVPTGPADEKDSESTSLPWPRTWRGVYLFVIGCFVLWVALLTALTRIFS